MERTTDRIGPRLDAGRKHATPAREGKGRKSKGEEGGGGDEQINTPPGCENAPNFRTNSVSSDFADSPEIKKYGKKEQHTHLIRPYLCKKHDDEHSAKDQTYAENKKKGHQARISLRRRRDGVNDKIKCTYIPVFVDVFL